MAAAYGILPEVIPYELYVGLWLNLERVWARPAMQTLRGVAAANSEEDPGLDLFESTALIEGEGEDVWRESVKLRTWAKAKRLTDG